LPADGTALPNGRNGDFGTSPIYRQLSNKPLFALTNLHGVPNANRNGWSRIEVLKTLLSSGIAGAAPTYPCCHRALKQKGTRRRCTDIGQNVPPRDQQVRLPQWVDAVEKGFSGR
jgi:hypothetical protein